MNHHEKFERLNEAIKSLKIFPVTIKDFTTILTQISLSKNPTIQEAEVHKLCGMYHDNLLTLMHFIKELVVQEFLDKYLKAEKLEFTQLKTDIDEATKQNGRLDRFISKDTRANVLQTLEKIDDIPAPEESRLKEFSSWLKGKVQPDEVGEVFAKVIGPLSDMIAENAILAVQSDYDYKKLKQAVEKVSNNAPKMKEVMEENKSALQEIKGILDDLEEGRGTNMSLSEEKRGVTKACNDVIELVNERLAF